MSASKGSFEKKDVNVGAIAALIGVLLILLGGTVLFTLFFNRMMNHAVSQHDASPSPMTQGISLPPEPRLQVNAAVDLIRMHDVENVTLNNYAWVDTSSGKVRIPIERAMAILAERGLPSRRREEQ